MSDINASNALPHSAVLFQMMTGHWVSQTLYVAAKLGIADLLANGPRPVEELAAATQTDAPSLQRVLRALASVGIFSEVAPGTFALTPRAALLQSGTPDSMRALAIMHSEEQYQAWGNVLYSVQTGKPGFEPQFGVNFFDYLAQHPESDRVFNEAMTGATKLIDAAVIEAYDFSPFKTFVDVGGGYGTLLSAILRNLPAARGVLFDLPHVVAAAEEQLQAAGVAERCTLVGGDWFVEIPAGGDAYLLAWILHDWDDERSLQILKQCRRAIPPHGKLLAMEFVIPPGDEPYFGKWMDLHMLVLFAARERTAVEFDSLFGAAGFKLTRIVPLSVGRSILEAVPV